MATPRAVLTASSVGLVLGAVAGCGSTGSHQLTARQVERAFSQAGIPFASEQDRTPTNPYLAHQPQPILLPRRAQPFAKHASAFLIAVSPVTFRSEIAYVFDSSSSAAAAARAEPLAQWMTSTDHPVTTARVANVLILAARPTSRVQEAISSLTQQTG